MKGLYMESLQGMKWYLEDGNVLYLAGGFWWIYEPSALCHGEIQATAKAVR